MDQRSTVVLSNIVKADSYISVEKLANLLNVSRRTIYNDLDKINHWLKDQNLSQVKQVRGKGLYLEGSVKNQLWKKVNPSDTSYYEYSKSERRAWIYIWLAGRSKPYFLDSFQNLFRVSRNTVIEDIKKLKEELDVNQVKLVAERNQGYKIEGNEIIIRRLLLQYLSDVIPKEFWLNFVKDLEEAYLNETHRGIQPYLILAADDLYEIKNDLNHYERQVEVEITDDVRNDLVVWFYFFVQRIEQGHYAEVDPAEREVIHSTKEFAGAKKMCDRLSAYFQLEIPAEEIDYFTRYLLSAKVNYNLNLQLENQEMKQLTAVVEKMVYDFQKYAAVAFPDQQRMIRNLLLHLKPTYYRIKYGIRIENILKKAVKNNYPEIFHLTKKVIHHVENLMDQKIDENEIAFIAMHFGGWLRKEGVVLEPKRKKLLIVCTNGLGTSRLLESQLEGLFSDVDISGVTSLREYKEIDNLPAIADFIISTIVLPDRGIPVFVVNPVLNNEDKEKLLKKVNSLFEGGSHQQTMSVDTVMDMIRRYAVIQDEKSLRNELKTYFYTPIPMNSGYNKPDLLELLPENRITVEECTGSWEEAIFTAARPLLDQKYITSNYIEKMTQMVKDAGPYIVISDQIALPHANPNEGVNKTGMSLLLLDKGIDLLGKSVRMIIVLASIDNEQHLKALSQLTQLFSDKSAKDKVMRSGSRAELIKLIQSYFKE
ncbi:BglG family transcription antiterminator [Lentibacillus salicampi]|uniref:BglG family transcription antiterminator n=1 Tax=Lentibacillus salicampi TaxID=175306 RepID=A0A4Y9A6H2_9BACI|nr:BglG family transcription antiterminator [Lentibacillus salicampi]TFJ91256.1 BglG family transcription antiterminator [Lentibacillus salicampi]